MVIWPTFRMGQYIVNDLPNHAPQFIFEPRLKINDCNIYDRAKSIYFKYILFHINLFDNEVLFISPVNTINNSKSLENYIDYIRGDSMIWDFVGHRSLPVMDYVVSIKGGPKVWRLLV